MFPNWIELWTTTGNQVPMQRQNYQQQQMMMAKPGINTQVVPQNNQGYYHNQYDQRNNYGGGQNVNHF